MKYILAVVIISLIVFIHELGHFIAAKCCNVRVLKFAVGMGPKLIGKQWGETEYSIRVFPFGGFCAMEGEDTDAISKSEIGEAAVSDGSRSLKNKPIWQRFIIFFAGPLMNVVLGYILAVILVLMANFVPTTTISGFHTVSDTDKTISALSHDSGLMEGDEIIKINGMRIFTTSDKSYQVNANFGKPMDVVVERDGEEITVKDVLFGDTNSGQSIDFTINGENKNPINVMTYAAKDTISTGRLIWISLVDLVTGKYNISEMSGPVGMVKEIGNAAAESETLRQAFLTLMRLSMFITVNLGIANLLPIPGLDGGRILFLIIEAIRRKPLKPEHEGIVNLVGIGMVLLLIVAVTFSDIIELFN